MLKVIKCIRVNSFVEVLKTLFLKTLRITSCSKKIINEKQCHAADEMHITYLHIATDINTHDGHYYIS